MQHKFGIEDPRAAESPVRLVRDRHARSALSSPHLVMANGDVLNGMPVQLAPQEGVGLVPSVLVQLESPLLAVSGTSVAVRTDRIRRIVGSLAAARREPPPGTVVLADGRQLAARSIRWRQYGLAILTAEGVVEATYADLADVVFPAVDLMAAVLDDNLWAAGVAGAAIVRFHATSGAVLTAARVSREVEQSRRRGGRLTSTVYYYLQPAWSEQPIALPESEVASCGYRGADEAPLSLLPAETLRNERLLGQREPWQANHAADGESLASADGREADIGIAAHAASAIAFELPPGAKSLSLSVGLDQRVGDGGCVRCQVLAERADGDILWDSGILQGRDGVQATGDIDVAGLARVVLAADYAHDDRPAGADPFDIRDQVVWLDPHVTLAAASADAGRLADRLAGLRSWELVGEGWKRSQVTSRWNVHESAWNPVVTLPAESALELSQSVRVAASSDVLELLVGCPRELDEHDFALTVNGRAVSWNTSDDRHELRNKVQNFAGLRLRDDLAAQNGDRLAYWWDLSAWQGQDVELSLVLRGQRAENELAWRRLSLRSAVAGLSQDGQPLASDVPLTAVEPVDAAEGRLRPRKDSLPRGRENEPIRFLGQRFAGGYGLTRESFITFPLRPEFKRFVAIAGGCHKVSGPLQVLVDGRVVWERPLASSLDSAEQIAIDLPAGAKTLTLACGKEGEYYSAAAFASAGFVTD